MKIKRRGFIAMAVLATNQAFAGKDIFSNNSKSRSQTFKDLFGLHSHFLPLELSSLHQNHTESLRNLGYRNHSEGCLLNVSKNYVVSPIGLKIKGELIDEVVLLFSKQRNWQFVGVLNQHEADLFLKLSKDLKNILNFPLENVLPQKRKIDGFDNSFICNAAKMTFKVSLLQSGITGSLAYQDPSMERVVILDKQKSGGSLMA